MAFFNDLILNTPNNQAIDPNMLNVTEMVGGEFSPVTFSDARMLNGELVITFNEEKIFNIGQSSNEERVTNNIFVQKIPELAEFLNFFKIYIFIVFFYLPKYHLVV